MLVCRKKSDANSVDQGKTITTGSRADRHIVTLDNRKFHQTCDVVVTAVSVCKMRPDTTSADINLRAESCFLSMEQFATSPA